MDGFRFYSPYWFIVAPILLLALAWAHQPRRRAAAIFSSTADLKNLPVTLAQRIRRLLPFIYGLGLMLLITAMARPQQGRSESVRQTDGIAIEMTVDISGSMEAIDFQLNDQPVNRLMAVKHVFKEFVEGSKDRHLPGRPNDAIGLVAFGGFADSKCPLTLDHGALVDILESLVIPKPMRDRNGNVINLKSLQEELQTAIGDGVGLALDRLKSVEAKSKILILLTDGDNTAGVIDPLDAAHIAATLGIKIYTIGIGTNGVVPDPQEDEFGQTFLASQRFHIDEDLLREMAQITNGKYFNASNTQSLSDVYAEIDKLEKSKVEETKYTEYTEFYGWLALPGLALLFVVMVLNHTRFRSLP